MGKKIPRLLISAPASGTGKTMVTCALLKAFSDQGKKIASFKCGPDYIDPMFHKEVLGIDSYNLDVFLCGEAHVRTLLAENAADADLALMEGVMGYYDGLAGISTEASAYDVARITETNVVLVMDCKGLSVSIVPYLQGFVNYKKNSFIKGVILNRLSPMMYERMKTMIERETSLKVYGYLPVMKECEIESRHLGLHLPTEETRTKESLKKLSEQARKTIDLEGLSKLAEESVVLPLELEQELLEQSKDSNVRASEKEKSCTSKSIERVGKVRIAVAMDDAFCFIYQENLKILEKYGAELVPFSPIAEKELPQRIDGLILYGGYPELHAEALSKNETMRVSIRQAIQGGMPCIAECGGFMYLMEGIRTESGKCYEMAGALLGISYHTSSLKRFGYVTLTEGTVFGEEVGAIPAHEFHYYDAESCGEAFHAQKPLSKRNWRCMVSTETILAGYPHIHYAGNEKVAEAFIKACRKRK